MLTVAISGFGRIGRNFLRSVLLDPQARQKISVVAINIGPADLKFTAHMFKYDTIMGTYPGSVQLEGDELVIDGTRIKIFAQKDPLQLPWKTYALDWVVESSGHFTKREGAELHLRAGARNVLITAPAKGEDVSIIPGVNDQAFDRTKHHIVSLGSCTTNAFAPTLQILDDTFTLQYGCMTTVHAYTNTQVLLDVEGEDIRRSRAAALNIIPTSTGAMKMIAKILPRLTHRIEALSIRVPVANVSLIDLTFTTEKPMTVTAINQAFIDAKKGALADIVDITNEPLVSSDFLGNEHSVIIDGQLTTVVGNNMGKIFGWYDNEWGYSARLKSFLLSAA